MFEEMTFENILSQMLENVQGDVDKREGSIIYDALAPVAMESAQMYADMDILLQECFADSASYYYLIKRAAERGIFVKEGIPAVVKVKCIPSDVNIPEATEFSIGEMTYSITENLGDGFYSMTCSESGENGNNIKDDVIPIEYVDDLEDIEAVEVIVYGTEDEDEEGFLAEYNLLTAKPVIFAANVSEDDLADDGVNNAGVQAVREYAKEEDCEVFVVCAEIEEEISQLDDDEKSMFLEDLGLEESGLEKLIKASYHLLGLISYLTAGEPEVRAWTIKKGTKAPQAAGKIHTDFERGFIRAEVVSYDDLMACGTHAAAKEKGLVRLEGKDYVVQDGDIMLFRFNV